MACPVRRPVATALITTEVISTTLAVATRVRGFEAMAALP